MSDTQNQEPKPTPEEIAHAETALRFRGLADETRNEMWMRHYDERADVNGGGLPTEEMPSQQEVRHRAEWAALERREVAELGAAWQAPESGADYIRKCGEAYQRDFDNRPWWSLDSAPPKSLTLPEPQNAAEQLGLKTYLASFENEFRYRPEIVFEARPTQEAAAAPVAPEQSTTLLPGEPEHAAEAPEYFFVRYSDEGRGALATPLVALPNAAAEPQAAAEARVEELEQRIYLAGDHLSRSMEMVLDTFFGFIGRNIGDHLSRSMEMVLDTFFGFFVAEPKMTAQQAHEHLQAAGNLETLHAHDVAAGVRANEAAHDWQSVMTINQQQYQDVRLAQTLGTPATAEANLGTDEHEAARQQQKLSM